eukprot:745687-Hanusia_phi.AAC.2
MIWLCLGLSLYRHIKVIPFRYGIYRDKWDGRVFHVQAPETLLLNLKSPCSHISGVPTTLLQRSSLFFPPFLSDARRLLLSCSPVGNLPCMVQMTRSYPTLQNGT